MNEHYKKAEEVLNNIIYVTLGTSDLDNNPWTTPLFVAFDKELNFYWVSPKDSRHSQNIQVNKNVSFVCFDSTVPKWTGVGIYFTAEAEEISDTAEMKKGIDLVFTRLEEVTPIIENYQGEKAYRVYRATPKQIWITSDKDVNGESIDMREELDIKLLQGIF